VHQPWVEDDDQQHVCVADGLHSNRHVLHVTDTVLTPHFKINLWNLSFTEILTYQVGHVGFQLIMPGWLICCQHIKKVHALGAQLGCRNL
jgi:hypothetical protein